MLCSKIKTLIDFNVYIYNMVYRSVSLYSAQGKRMEPEKAAKQTVLITGGGGYFGFRLVHSLIITLQNKCKDCGLQGNKIHL